MILDLNYHKHKPQIDYFMAYVGVSRVRHASDIRCLPAQPEAIVYRDGVTAHYQFPSYLTGLRPHVDLLVWQESYNGRGEFSDASAAAYLHYLERMKLYSKPEITKRKEDKIVSMRRLQAAISAPTPLGLKVQQRERGIPLPSDGEVPVEEPAWMYLSLIWEVMVLTHCERTRTRIRNQYDRVFGQGAWASTIEHYREHLSVIDQVAPLAWDAYPTLSKPFEMERVLNPMSPRLFHADYHHTLQYQEYVRQTVPGLIVGWARIVWFVNQFADSLGQDWQCERAAMQAAEDMMLQV